MASGLPATNSVQGSLCAAWSQGAKLMKPAVLIGIVLIVLGALALAYQGLNYSHQEKVLDVGPLHATVEKHDRIPIPPILGGLALIGGIALLVGGNRKNS